MDAACPTCLGTNPQCPDCLGTGLVQASIAQGEMFSVDCIDCGEHIGGGIMGGDSPIRELPKDKPCVFCGGVARSSKAGD